MRFRQVFRDYFTFTKNERIGLVILLILILIFLVANQCIYYFETPGKADQEKFERFLAEMEKKSDREKHALKLFLFDPNTIDSTSLDHLLIPQRVKNNMLRYRKKGGHFYHATDFRKIYGMNDSVFVAIEKYIRISPVKKDKELSTNHRKRKVFVEKTGSVSEPVKKRTVVLPVELNSATADDLIKLPGIGAVLSKRIVKYRQLLGGFVSLQQLHEVYGLKQETIEIILPYLELNTGLVKKININFAEAGQLVKHPYIDWKTANAIVDFRSLNGFIERIQLLEKNNVLDESDFHKISPYLKTKD